MQEDHKRIDPRLEPVAGTNGHQVACLLTPEVRAQIWRGLEAGESVEDLKRLSPEKTVGYSSSHEMAPAQEPATAAQGPATAAQGSATAAQGSATAAQASAAEEEQT